jgi:molybdenum cofactor guanylyltransferase
MLKTELTGVIIAGGRSKRMGVEKGLVQLGSKPLIMYPVGLLKELCSNVIISANSHAFDFIELDVISDKAPGNAPMIGIYSALLSAATEYILVLSCDMPFINVDLLQHIINLSGDAKAVIASHDGYAEPLCGIYHHDLIPELELQIAEKKFKLITFLEKVESIYVEINENLLFYNPGLFLNVNTPGDLERAEMLLSGKEII